MITFFHSTRRCLSAVASLHAVSNNSTAVSTVNSEEPIVAIPVYLKPSSNPRKKPSFYIPRMRDDAIPQYSRKADGLGTAQPLFTITSPTCEFYALRLPLLKAGFKRIASPATTVDCNLIWGKSMPLRNVTRTETHGSSTPALDLPIPRSAERAAQLKALTMNYNNQFFNHFPLSHRNTGCKKGISKNIRRVQKCTDDACLRRDLKESYAFVPRTWWYPQERDSLIKQFAQTPTSSKFIWKPARGSCGRGIYLSQGGKNSERSWRTVEKSIIAHREGENGIMYNQYVVQEYVDNPLLLNGKKMDLRLYVAVTSYDPLVIYLHEDGLVRLAAEEYEGTESFQKFQYLTNFSIGRKHFKFANKKNDVSETSSDSSIESTTLKWSLNRFWKHIDTHYSANSAGVPRSVEVKEKIALVITRTLMAVQGPIRVSCKRVQMPGKYFEMYGFDIMLKEDLSPVLLEVNTLPSLESSSAFDYVTKTTVVADLLNLIMMEPYERAQKDMKIISSCGSLNQPPVPALKGCFHTLEEQKSSSCGKVDESKEDLLFRLKDEWRYARGFRRIFPPSPDETPRSEYPLRIRGASSDIRLFNNIGLLSDKDKWALQS